MAIFPKLLIKDATFQARSNLFSSSLDKEEPTSFRSIIFTRSTSDQNVAVINLDLQYGHRILSGNSFVSYRRSHLAHLMHINLCFVLIKRSLINSKTPFSIFIGAEIDFFTCFKIG